jgi:hypothetical protein
MQSITSAPWPVACAVLLAGTVALFGQSDTAVADAGVSIAFQNSGGDTVEGAVSVAFQNSAAYGTLGNGVTVFFQGAILVTTNLVSASYTVTGPATYTGSGTLSNQATAPPGQYTISFAPVAGYKTPGQQTQTLSNGGNITFNGTYTPLSVIGTSPATLTFAYQQGVVGPPSPQTVTVSSSGRALNFTAAPSTAPPGGTWLAVSPTKGNTGASSGTLAVSFNPDGLAVGTYNGQVTITSPGAATSPLTVPITLTVSAQCTPPQSITATFTGTAGLADVVISNTQVGQCSTQASMQIQNYVAAWLGVTINSPQTMSFAADLKAGLPGVSASLGLVPPCSTNIVQCTSPGLAQWVVSSTASGAGTIDMEMTSAASFVNLTAMVLGELSDNTISIATVVNVGNQMYAAVPDFNNAANCLANGNGPCIISSIIAMTLNQQELEETILILKSVNINVSEKVVVTALLGGVSDQALLELGTLGVMIYQTGTLGHPGIEIIGLQAQ